MTTKGSRRSAAETPRSTVIPTETITSMEVIEQAPEAAPAEQPVQQAVAAAVATQAWLMSFPVNDLYTIGVTPMDQHFEATVVLFDRSGNSMPLAKMTVNNLTETDILRGTKRLVGAILNNLARSPNLI